MLAWEASVMAGNQCVGADPEVQSKRVGKLLRLLDPRARKAADLSSRIGMHSIFGCLSNAKTRGVDREPGEKNTWLTCSLDRQEATVSPQIKLDCPVSSGI